VSGSSPHLGAAAAVRAAALRWGRYIVVVRLWVPFEYGARRVRSRPSWLLHFEYPAHHFTRLLVYYPPHGDNARDGCLEHLGDLLLEEA